ncbi:MAG TPA: hypothetical protein VGQ09_12780 [Chitinophagaceae bacterium]|jgi:hypothetical protein|nr:hypothetical protein [Chitinophagaceae bacterium]
MNKDPNEERQKKFQVTIGEKIAFVEIISLKNHICAVEFPGHEPIFITQVRDKNNNLCWISIPQGNDDLAVVIGSYIEEQFSSENQ